MLSFVMGRQPFVRESILHAAFDLFAKEGYEAVSTRMIAQAAKVGSASMFKHFPTKEALGRELYRIALGPILTSFAALEAEKPNRETALGRSLELLYEAYDKRPRMLALLVFPPHEFQPWETDRSNPASVRAILSRLTGLEEDDAAILWGAMTGPLQDRFLRRREGLMLPFAPAHSARLVRLCQDSEPL